MQIEATFDRLCLDGRRFGTVMNRANRRGRCVRKGRCRDAVLGLALLVLAGGCSSNSDAGGDPVDTASDVATGPRTVFTNASVLTMTDADPDGPQTVVVEGEQIVRIGPTTDEAFQETDTVIDVKGKYLMPGLCDMYAHVESASELIRYLARGVTTIRVVDGNANHLDLRDEVNTGLRVAPTLIVAGPGIEGAPSAYPGMVAVESEQAARDRVAEHAGLGYDQISLYHNLSPKIFAAAVDAAHEHGLKAVGRVPFGVSAIAAFETGLDASSHLFGVLGAVSKDDTRFDDNTGVAEYYLRTAPTTDVDKTVEVAEAADDNDVWLVPALEAARILTASADEWDAWSEDSRNTQVAFLLNAKWSLYTAARAELRPDLFSDGEPAWQNLLGIVGAAHVAGAKLLIGTDYGMPYIYPGEGVHRELAHFVEAGISNEAALRAATALPAKFLEQEGTFGTIAVGARADMVLLEKNPIADIAAVGEVFGVMVRGEWLDDTALSHMIRNGTLPEPEEETESRPEIDCVAVAEGTVEGIEDFDDGDRFVTGDNLDGSWYAYDDGTGGDLSPDNNNWYTTPGGLEPGGEALHVQGGGYTNWGIGVAFSLSASGNRRCRYDATYWDGISFWAKGNVSAFTVGAAELDVLPVSEGGRCESSCCCYGSHRTEIDLDACWRRYAFRFDELTPPDWGIYPGPLDVDELMDIDFYVYPNTTPDNRFDFWLDDIAFFKGEKPDAEERCEAPDGGVFDAGSETD